MFTLCKCGMPADLHVELLLFLITLLIVVLVRHYKKLTKPQATFVLNCFDVSTILKAKALHDKDESFFGQYLSY